MGATTSPLNPGLLEGLLAAHSEVVEELAALRDRLGQMDGAVAYTPERCAELLTGLPYSDPRCLRASTIAKLLRRGHLVQVPQIRNVLITRKSLEALAASGVPEI